MKKHLMWTGLLLAGSLLLTSCGFHLRGSLPLERYPAIFVDAKKHSELASLLSQQLESNKVKLLTELDPKAPALMLQQDSLERRTLSLFPNGQVAEYELIYRVKYQLLLPDHEWNKARLPPAGAYRGRVLCRQWYCAPVAQTARPALTAAILFLILPVGLTAFLPLCAGRLLFYSC